NAVLADAVGKMPLSFFADPDSNRGEFLSVDKFKNVSCRIHGYAVFDGSASIKDGYFLFPGHTFKKLDRRKILIQLIMVLMLTINDKFSIKSFVRRDDPDDVQAVYKV